MKTTKAWAKRVRHTRRGLLLVRRTGQNHFNAKERAPQRHRKHGMRRLSIVAVGKKAYERFLAPLRS